MRLFIISAICVLTSFSALAEDTVRRITVTGVGTMTAAPDLAVVSVGVHRFEAVASAAMSANSVQMIRVFEALKGAGIEPRDIQTAQLSLRPRWDRRSNNTVPKIIGFEANNVLTIRVRALDRVGEVLDSLTKAGANRINSIQFSMNKPRPLQDQARQAAVVDARAKAELYASAAGVSLGDVISIVEGGIAPNPLLMEHMGVGSIDSDAVPIAQGELTLRSTVTIVYELE